MYPIFFLFYEKFSKFFLGKNKHEKIEKLDDKLKMSDKMKSDKFKAFDMFAPKTPKLTPKLQREFSREEHRKTPQPIVINKTATPQVSKPISASPLPKTPILAKSHPEKKKFIKVSELTPRPKAPKVEKAPKIEKTPKIEKRTDSFLVHSESKEKKHYPGFPMSQTEAIDKEKQYGIDMENSRRLLAEAREKRMLEQKAKKLNNKN